MNNSKTDVVMALSAGLASLLLFLVGIWDQGYIGFETRFALFAREMFANGPGWFPTTYGQPYPDYPAMSTFLIYLVARLLGEVNKFATVLPTAISASITVFLAYRIVRHYDKNWAFYCVLILLLTVTFANEARAISLDQTVATISIGSFYLVWRAETFGKGTIPWIIWPLLVFGFSVRGPLGIVIPSTGIAVFYLFQLQWRKLLIYGVASLAMLLALWLVLLQLAKASGGEAFVAEVIRMQIGGRMNSGATPEFSAYFKDAFGNYALAYPFAVFGLVVLPFHFFTQPQRFTDAKVKLVLFMAAWALVILLGMSFPDTKKARYLLSMTFPLSVVASYFLCQGEQGVLAIVRKLYTGIILALPGILAIALPFAAQKAVKKGINPADYPVDTVILILVALQLVAIAWFVYRRKKKRSLRAELSLSVVAFWLVSITILEPAELQIRDSRGFVSRVEAIRLEQGLPLVFYQEQPDVMGKVYVVNAERLPRPYFIEDLAELSGFPSGVCLVTRAAITPGLQGLSAKTSLAASGSMDDVPFLAYTITPE
ncbi:MAG: glycosyltransferase family 39 protein [Gammaproteobacteria bacterium]|nr:glycosyltransferase family 39 protein [Gammaproteobacteria bacterium]